MSAGDPRPQCGCCCHERTWGGERGNGGYITDVQAKGLFEILADISDRLKAIEEKVEKMTPPWPFDLCQPHPTTPCEHEWIQLQCNPPRNRCTKCGMEDVEP